MRLEPEGWLALDPAPSGIDPERVNVKFGFAKSMDRDTILLEKLLGLRNRSMVRSPSVAITWRFRTRAGAPQAP